jgi:hypothetical protein
VCVWYHNEYWSKINTFLKKIWWGLGGGVWLVIVLKNMVGGVGVVWGGVCLLKYISMHRVVIILRVEPNGNGIGKVSIEGEILLVKTPVTGTK